MLTGVFADAAWSGGPNGLLAGHPAQVPMQVSSVLIVLAYSGAATFVILKAARGWCMPLRISGRVEGVGLDVDRARRRGLHDRRRRHPRHAGGAPRPARRVERRRRQHWRRAVKLIVAIIRPEQLSDVLEALFHAEVRGLTISRVQGHGGEMEHVENYRGTTVKMALAEKVRLEIGVSNHFVQPTVDAILGARGPARSATARSWCCRSRRSTASAPARRIRTR